jgi:septal ring-binding cell division protein DamX
MKTNLFVQKFNLNPYQFVLNLMIIKMRSILKYFVISIGLTLIMQNSVMADEATRALEAMSKQNYQEAIKIWAELVAEGNIVAEYNLALAMQKSAAEASQVNGWLKAAARNGLVNAYGRFQPDAVKPGAHTRAILIQSPDDWIREQNPRYYTLQLASSTNPKLIQKYYRENKLEGEAGYYRNYRQGKNWYALVYGSYPSVNEAKQAVNSLPVELRKWSPWVRKFQDSQRIMQQLN